MERNGRPEPQTLRVNAIQIVEPQLRSDQIWTSQSTVRTGRNAVGNEDIETSFNYQSPKSNKPAREGGFGEFHGCVKTVLQIAGGET